MGDLTLDRFEPARHGSSMLSCALSPGTRLLLVLALLAVGPAGLLRGTVALGQDPADPRRGAAKKPGQDDNTAGRKPAGTPRTGDPKGVAVIPPPPPPPPPQPSQPVAKPPKEPTEPSAKLPRFAAFKTDETNMRVGPGQRYPIEWVYKRRDLPVEVEKEYDVWRYVRDPDGVRGWVHQVTLTERRTFVVKGADATLRADAKEAADAIAVLRPGVIGRLRSCDDKSKWCQVQVGTHKGYLRRDQIWGLLPDEVVTPS